jgi:hypothetical protein
MDKRLQTQSVRFKSPSTLYVAAADSDSAIFAGTIGQGLVQPGYLGILRIGS